MKILLLNWKDQNFDYQTHNHDITNYIIIHENGCVCGIDKHNSQLKLIDIMSKNEVELYFSKYKDQIPDFENYNYLPEDHIEYYIKETNTLSQIALFLKPNNNKSATIRSFTIKAFTSFIKFNEKDVLSSRNIAKAVIYEFLIPHNYVENYYSYFRVTDQGRTWGIEQSRLLQKQLVKNTRKMLNLAESITYEDHIEKEWGKFKNKSIKEIYETIKKYPESILQGFSILAYHYDRKNDIKDFLVRLNKPSLSPNMFKKAYLDYQETRREVEEQEEEENLVKLKPKLKKPKTTIPSHDNNLSSHDNDNNLPSHKNNLPSHDNNLPSHDHDNNHDHNLPSKKDSDDFDIITANEYLKWLSVDIEAKIFGNTGDLLDSDKIKNLHSNVRTGKMELNLNHPLNFTYCMAVLLTHNRLTKPKIKPYIKKYNHNLSIMDEIMKRSKEIHLILKGE
jgi:hypothetical protein